ncbi:MAG: hypothetical protein WDW36_004298 [Sanguina aurantia]
MDMPSPKLSQSAIFVAGALLGGAVVYCGTKKKNTAAKESDTYLSQTVDVWQKWLKDTQKSTPGQPYQSAPSESNQAPAYSPKHQPPSNSATPSTTHTSPQVSKPQTQEQQQQGHQQQQQQQLQQVKTQHHQQQQQQQQRKRAQADPEGNFFGPCKLADLEDDEILSEALTRNVQFFGLTGQKAIGSSFVVVVGLGGVGSHAAHMLLRSGVGRLRLIDFDQVTLSSLNRHALATRADVGTSKAACLASHFRDIMPEARVEACVKMYTAEAEEELLSGEPDWVLDAIDNIDTKVDLLKACLHRKLKVLAVAGAGAKADPTRLRFVDVSESVVDPLARALRSRLRREHNIVGGIPVLLSTETQRCKLVDLTGTDREEPTQLLDYQIVPHFRVRSIPVLGTTPAIFGMAAAAHILCGLAGSPFVGEAAFPARGPEYARQLDRLLAREEARAALLAERKARANGATAAAAEAAAAAGVAVATIAAAEEEEGGGGDAGDAGDGVEGDAMGAGGSAEDEVTVDVDDVSYLVRELWRGFSARSSHILPVGGNKGMRRCTAGLSLTRWDATQPPTIHNLILLTTQEADEHDNTTLEALRESEPAFVERVEKIMQRARLDHI